MQATPSGGSGFNQNLVSIRCVLQSSATSFVSFKPRDHPVSWEQQTTGAHFTGEATKAVNAASEHRSWRHSPVLDLPDQVSLYRQETS